MTISAADKELVYNLAKPADSATDQVLEGYIRLVTYLEQVPAIRYKHIYL
jgi:hypothetical protein